MYIFENILAYDDFAKLNKLRESPYLIRLNNRCLREHVHGFIIIVGTKDCRVLGRLFCCFL